MRPFIVARVAVDSEFLNSSQDSRRNLHCSLSKESPTAKTVSFSDCNRLRACDLRILPKSSNRSTRCKSKVLAQCTYFSSRAVVNVEGHGISKGVPYSYVLGKYHWYATYEVKSRKPHSPRR